MLVEARGRSLFARSHLKSKLSSPNEVDDADSSTFQQGLQPSSSSASSPLRKNSAHADKACSSNQGEEKRKGSLLKDGQPVAAATDRLTSQPNRQHVYQSKLRRYQVWCCAYASLLFFEHNLCVCLAYKLRHAFLQVMVKINMDAGPDQLASGAGNDMMAAMKER